MRALLDLARAFGLAAEAQLARAARYRGADAAYGRHVAAALRRAAPALAAALPDARPSGIRLVEPVAHTRGGFFSCFAACEGGPDLFVKAVPSASREAVFWAAWRRGGIRTRGDHYVLAPPIAEFRGRTVTLLAFARDDALPKTRRTAFRRFRGRLDEVVRAIADFNSDHLGGDVALPEPDFGRSYPVPGRRGIARHVGIERARTHALVETMKATSARWRHVARALDGATRCLCHMDLGTGNVVPRGGRCVFIDFGSACIAPAGADLHTVLRFGGRGSGAGRELAEAYADVFARKGIALDLEAVLHACQAYFATRYTTPRLRSVGPEVFAEAAEMGSALAARLGDGRLLHR
jgi:hypothetical protein